MCVQESVAAFKGFSASNAAGAAPKKKPAPKKAPKQDAAPAAPQPKKESPPQQQAPQPKPKQPTGESAAALVYAGSHPYSSATAHPTPTRAPSRRSQKGRGLCPAFSRRLAAGSCMGGQGVFLRSV